MDGVMTLEALYGAARRSMHGSLPGDPGDRSGWLVVPGGGTYRDSGPLAESNAEAARRILDDAGVAWEVVRLGSCLVGWAEETICEPTETGARVCEELAGALAYYPVLDDCDYSERAWTHAVAGWCSDDMLRRLGAGDVLADWLCDGGRAETLAGAIAREHGIDDHCDDPHVSDEHVSRSELAALVTAMRREERAT